MPYAALVARVVVDVMLKPEIHDPQGEAIASACHRLGLDRWSPSVRASGSRSSWTATGPPTRRRSAQWPSSQRELLANPVIEEFTVEPG